MRPARRIARYTLLFVFLAFTPAALAAGLADTYPEFANGMFAHARLETLPESQLMRADDMVVTADMLKDKLSELPDAAREEAERYQFYLLKGLATERILIREVTGETDPDIHDSAMQTRFNQYRNESIGEVSVSDEEVQAFFEENSAMMSGMPLEQIRPGIEGHLKQQKQEAAWDAHVKSMGERISIVLDEDWTVAQIRRIKDNPVDKARAAGKPAMVNFGAEGCPACTALKPVMASVREEVGDQASIIEVNLREKRFLASRFNVSGIPLLVFYDRDGKETHRHTGAMSKGDILRELKEIGVI